MDPAHRREPERSAAMTAQPLTPETRDRLNAAFASADRAEAERMLVHECGANLPGSDDDSDPRGFERVRYAAMKLSGGRLDLLREAIELAKLDWRDLLMAAGFGEDITAHEPWWPGERLD